MQTTGNNIINFVKNINIVEFHDHIWNRHETYIQISTNMPDSGSVVREIHVNISESKQSVAQ